MAICEKIFFNLALPTKISVLHGCMFCGFLQDFELLFMFALSCMADDTLTSIMFAIGSQPFWDFSEHCCWSPVRKKYILIWTPLILFFKCVRANSCVQQIDRSVECTSSAIQALVMFRELYPGYRDEEIKKCIKGASKFIESKQRKDGTWYLKSSCLLYAVIHSFNAHR